MPIRVANMITSFTLDPIRAQRSSTSCTYRMQLHHERISSSVAGSRFWQSLPARSEIVRLPRGIAQCQNRARQNGRITVATTCNQCVRAGAKTCNPRVLRIPGGAVR